MEREEVMELLEALDCVTHRAEFNGDWINVSCPLAPYTHEKGTDSAPSFGIKVGDESFFHCFTCRENGSIVDLIDSLSIFRGQDLDYLLPYATGEGLVFKAPTDAVEEDEGLGEPLSEDYLQVFASAAEHPYVKSRHIDSATARTLELCEDVDLRGAERILFPVRDTEGNLYGFSGRAVKNGVRPKVRDYYGLRKELLLLGSHLVKKTDKYVLLCEGPFDYARLRGYGYPAIATLHSSVSSQQARILEAIGRTVICFLDNDKAGRLGTLKVAKKLENTLPVYRVVYPRLTSGRVIKDPGEVFKREMVDHMVSTARAV